MIAATALGWEPNERGSPESRAQPYPRAPRARSGAVAIVQRFGGALTLKVDPHGLALDGVFVLDGGIVTSRSVRRLTRGTCRESVIS